MARKKKNNIVCKRGNYYYRIRVFLRKEITDEGVERIFQKEITQSLYTKKKGEAIAHGKQIEKYLDDIKSGLIKKEQFKELFPFMNDKGTSELICNTLETMIPKYLDYKNSKQRASTVNRDRIAINQLCEFIGYTKPIAEIDYLHIEGGKGLIQHLQLKEYSNTGINISLRHLRAFFNYCYKKAKVINEPIEFDMLPEDEQECFIDEHQIQAIHDYINEDQHGIDSFFKRAFIFYELTGVRAIEPFIGELYGDWLFVDASKSKGKNLRKIQLSDDLKAILLEMQAFRDVYKANGSPEPNVRAYCRISKTLLKIKRALNFNTNRKITIKSFRHHYGIKRVYTTGNIFQVAMEMGHKNVTTTQEYLRFQPDEIKEYFPSLISIIESMENMPKNVIRGTKGRGTLYSNVPKLLNSHRE
jgi:integrase|tara:strand:+ start:397 stop:1641 length:1245 start_codon:yes stop_codon:yes gene_type:complete